MKRTILTLITLGMMLVSAAPLAAQDASPRFFIESIEVRNAKRVSKDVVIAESRLSAGREYSEAELRDASTRLSRLPFLLSVEFSLEKGSERGKHVLVLSIVETKPFFFALDLPVGISQGDGANVSFGDEFAGEEGSSVVGFRWFVGRRGMVHAGLYAYSDLNDLSNDLTSASVGYTQYDLFGTRAFATLSVRRPIDGRGGAITPELVVGIPLSPNQTLTLQTNQTDWSRTSRMFGPICLEEPDLCTVELDFSQRTFRARWSYNTTNNPFVPTRGTVVSIAPIYTRQDATGTLMIYGPDPETGEVVLLAEPTEHTEGVGLEASAERFFELSDRNSFSTSIAGSRSRIRSEYDSEWDLPERTTGGYSAVVRAKFIRSLWSQERRREGDSLLEFSASHAIRSHLYDRFDQKYEGTQLGASWVRRSSWGTLRLGLRYAW